jgi:hypothetical protein
MLSILIAATHFDLPSYFVIASAEHPLLLFDPQGILKGSFGRGFSYLGALAYIASGGRVAVPFARLPLEEPALYRQAVSFAIEAIDNCVDARRWQDVP